MIRKLLLQDFAIYEAWESPEFNNVYTKLHDLYATNASGKSTLVDAITILVGLNRPSDLFEKRSPTRYQRVPGRPAFIAAWFNNPVLASGTRRFAKYGDTYTVVARIDENHAPAVEYRLLDGALTLKEAIDTQRKGWLNTADYNRIWQDRNVRKEQRRQRIFKVGDTDRVRSNKTNELHQVFRDYCSDPDDLEKQENTRKAIGATANEIDRLDHERAACDRERDNTDATRRKREKLKSAYIEMRRERNLELVGEIKELEDLLRTQQAQAGDMESKRIEARTRMTELQAEIDRLETGLRGNKKQTATETAKLEKLNDRHESALSAYVEADKGLGEITEFEKVLRECRRKRLAPSPSLAKVHKDATERKYKLTLEKGALHQTLREAEVSLAALKEHRLPLNVLTCLEAIKEAGCQVEQAWQFLPQNRPQGYEEALGRNRFGLLAKAKDRDKVLAIMAQHDYPGPVSSLDAEAYVNLLDTTATPDGFQTELGAYVTIKEIPYLNPALLKPVIKERDRKVAEIKVALNGIDAALGKLETELEEGRAAIEAGEKRDDLEKNEGKWPELRKRHKQAMDAYKTLQEQTTELTRFLATLDAEREGAARQVAQKSLAMEDAAKLVNASSNDLTTTEKDLERKLALARPFLAELRSTARSSKHHRELADAYRDEDIKGQSEPPEQELADLKQQVGGLESTINELDGKLAMQREELQKSKQTLEKLVEIGLGVEEKAFRRVKKNAEELGSKYSCPVRLNREKRYDKKTGQEDWHLVYEVGHYGDSGLEWTEINDSRHSTGEGVKASIIFLMGLSNSADNLFYLFDEPAKNFDEGNIIDMFSIFKGITDNQVIVTSATRLDYGDDVTVQQWYLQAEPKTKKNRRALPARHAIVDGKMKWAAP